MKILSKLTRVLAGGPAIPVGEAGCRAYAIGDIHGRLDALNRVLERIEDDISSRPKKKNFLIFLGDLIDRGPDSAGVIERVRTLAFHDFKAVFLCGNHEEVLLRLLNGERRLISQWLKFGGAECAMSYGIDPDELAAMEERTALRLLFERIPEAHREFMKSFGDTFRFGGYLFVHAGIRPGVAVEHQDVSDLRWIRGPFLSDTKDHGFVVVHGHTIVEEVEERANRIGIDTGAYRSGRLTAIAVEGDKRWYLDSNIASKAPLPKLRSQAA